MRDYFQTFSFLLSFLLLLASCGPSTDTANSGSSIVTLPAATAPSTVTLIVPGPTDKEFVETVPFEEGMTVGQLLDAQSTVRVTTKSYPGMGRLLTSINAQANEDMPDHFWQYCINGTIADKGIDDMQLSAGDLVQWHYVKYGETPCKKIGE